MIFTLRINFRIANYSAENISMNLLRIMTIFKLFRQIAGYLWTNSISLPISVLIILEHHGWLVDSTVDLKKNCGKPVMAGFHCRVSTFISIIDQIEYSQKGKMPVFKSDQMSPKALIKNFGIRNNLKHYIKEAPGEDIFWCIYVPQIFKHTDFKIADPTTAAHFSFEVFPKFLFEMVTNGKLPMGCHNWENYDFKFWKSYING